MARAARRGAASSASTSTREHGKDEEKPHFCSDSYKVATEPYGPVSAAPSLIQVIRSAGQQPDAKSTLAAAARALLRELHHDGGGAWRTEGAAFPPGAVALISFSHRRGALEDGFSAGVGEEDEARHSRRVPPRGLAPACASRKCNAGHKVVRLQALPEVRADRLQLRPLPPSPPSGCPCFPLFSGAVRSYHSRRVRVPGHAGVPH